MKTRLFQKCTQFIKEAVCCFFFFQTVTLTLNLAPSVGVCNRALTVLTSQGENTPHATNNQQPSVNLAEAAADQSQF